MTGWHTIAPLEIMSPLEHIIFSNIQNTVNIIDFSVLWNKKIVELGFFDGSQTPTVMILYTNSCTITAAKMETYHSTDKIVDSLI